MNPQKLQLSDGTISKLLLGQKIEDEPILQILNLRCLCSKLQFRVTLSDGIHFTTLAVISGDLVDEFKLFEYCCVKLIQYKIQDVLNLHAESRPLILIEDILPLQHKDKPIGCPENFEHRVFGKLKQVCSERSHQMASGNHSNVAEVINKESEKLAPILKKPPGDLTTQDCLGTIVKNIRGWVVRARVLNILPVRLVGPNKCLFFAMDICDQTHTIRALAFGDTCKRLSEYIKVDKVYWFSDGTFRPAKKNLNRLNHPYELCLENFSVVVECADIHGLPSLEFDFFPLNKDIRSATGEVADIIGICVRAGELFSKTEEKRNIKFRRLYLVSPESKGAEVEMEIWGKFAEDLNSENHPVIVVKNCKVFNRQPQGLLFLDNLSVFLVNPENVKEVAEMRAWFNREHKNKVLETVLRLDNCSFVDARKAVLLSKASECYINCQVNIIDTDSQFLVTMSCESCRSPVYDLNMEKLVCTTCGFVEIGVMKNILTKIRVGEEGCSEWAYITDTECRKLFKIKSNYLVAHDTCYWKSMKTLVGRKCHIYMKYDKNPDAKLACQILGIAMC